jgi:hypothetical protein
MVFTGVVLSRLAPFNPKHSFFLCCASVIVPKHPNSTPPTLLSQPPSRASSISSRTFLLRLVLSSLVVCSHRPLPSWQRSSPASCLSSRVLPCSPGRQAGLTH